MFMVKTRRFYSQIGKIGGSRKVKKGIAWLSDKKRSELGKAAIEKRWAMYRERLQKEGK
jgi:hypothetical protein